MNPYFPNSEKCYRKCCDRNNNGTLLCDACSEICDAIHTNTENPHLHPLFMVIISVLSLGHVYETKPRPFLRSIDKSALISCDEGKRLLNPELEEWLIMYCFRGTNPVLLDFNYKVVKVELVQVQWTN